MTNGVFEIKTELGVTKLRFGYMASMEFEQRFFKNATTNSAKIFTDLIYSGLYCEAVRSENPIPEYEQASTLIDFMSEQDDFDEVSIKIWNTYNESKWGKSFAQRIKEFTDKKKAEADQESQ